MCHPVNPISPYLTSISPSRPLLTGLGLAVVDTSARVVGRGVRCCARLECGLGRRCGLLVLDVSGGHEDAFILSQAEKARRWLIPIPIGGKHQQ